MQDYEKLGVFYLGRSYDLARSAPTDGLVLYDSRDLVTHAVCVGMTGSGKTGLCIGVIEEAAIDGIPAIVIDPKGDLSNLLLTFPNLQPADFRPWINEDDAQRKALTPDAFAAAEADKWSKGLASWDQDGARIARLKDAADFTIYTPGSSAGVPVSILKSFAPPAPAVLEDGELFQEQVRTTVTSLLGLIGVDADPIQSREHILLSSIFTYAWKQGTSLDLAGVIQFVQQPPVQRVGVIDVDTFFPQKDRFGLAMQLNNLLAAPGFESWMQGDPLDVGALLHTQSGKPRVSIFSIAHLSDAERMFFVSLLLNQILGWTRTQSGTTSLRALVYMDEIYGFFPPTANPPSKTPLLTLLKQARAFGVGLMLATQNPVDLDYKGLSNAGTWFIGRLQTERDKMRVLDGLEGAAAGAGEKFDRQRMEQTLAGLGNRVFLMNNVHDDEPIVFQTRWTLSYLRGPLTRPQIKTLMDAKRAAAPAAGTTAVSPAAVVARPVPVSAPSAATASSRPVLPSEISQVFIPARSTAPVNATLIYRPHILGMANVFYVDSKTGDDAHRDIGYLIAAPTGAADLSWQDSEACDVDAADLETAPTAGASFEAPGRAASTAKSYDAWKKKLVDAMYRTEKLDLFKSDLLSETSKPLESERDFRARLQLKAREERDAQKERIRQKYAPKVASFQERLRRADLALQAQKQQATASKWQAAISLGATVLGAFMGRKAVSASTIGRATTTARGVSRSMKESADVGRAEENSGDLQEQINALDAQFNADLAQVDAKLDPSTEPLRTISLRPKKSDIAVRLVSLAWVPFWTSDRGDIRADS